MRSDLITALLLVTVALLLTAGAVQGLAQTAETDTTAEALAQRQLDAYNARDIDAFAACYAEDVEIYDRRKSFKEPLYTGRAKLYQRYKQMFARLPDLHCTLVNRIAEGAIVIDHEHVVFEKDKPPVKAIAVYEVRGGLIQRVWFY